MPDLSKLRMRLIIFACPLLAIAGVSYVSSSYANPDEPILKTLRTLLPDLHLFPHAATGANRPNPANLPSTNSKPFVMEPAVVLQQRQEVVQDATPTGEDIRLVAAAATYHTQLPGGRLLVALPENATPKDTETTPPQRLASMPASWQPMQLPPLPKNSEDEQGIAAFHEWKAAADDTWVERGQLDEFDDEDEPLSEPANDKVATPEPAASSAGTIDEAPPAPSLPNKEKPSPALGAGNASVESDKTWCDNRGYYGFDLLEFNPGKSFFGLFGHKAVGATDATYSPTVRNPGPKAIMGMISGPYDFFGPGSEGYDEGVVTGRINGNYVSKQSVLSLGHEGSVIVKVKDGALVNGDGADFVVYENGSWKKGGSLTGQKLPDYIVQAGKAAKNNPNGPSEYQVELAAVDVSATGEPNSFVEFPCETKEKIFMDPNTHEERVYYPGCAGNTAAIFGGDPFDLASLPGAPKEVRFIRIRDVGGNNQEAYSNTEGFDLDTIGLWNTTCNATDKKDNKENLL